jgi:hypothetical protein
MPNEDGIFLLLLIEPGCRRPRLHAQRGSRAHRHPGVRLHSVHMLDASDVGRYDLRILGRGVLVALPPGRPLHGRYAAAVIVVAPVL